MWYYRLLIRFYTDGDICHELFKYEEELYYSYYEVLVFFKTREDAILYIKDWFDNVIDTMGNDSYYKEVYKETKEMFSNESKEYVKSDETSTFDYDIGNMELSIEIVPVGNIYKAENYISERN